MSDRQWDDLTEEEKEERRIAQTLEARMSKAKSTKLNRISSVSTSAPQKPAVKTAPVIDEEALRLAALRQKQMEEEREAQERNDIVLKNKAKNRGAGIDRFFNKPKDEGETASVAGLSGEEEERERNRILRSVSGRGLFSGGGQAFKKKSLKELEEDRIAWRDREEAKRQKEAEERRRKQEEIQKRDEQKQAGHADAEVVLETPKAEGPQQVYAQAVYTSAPAGASSSAAQSVQEIHATATASPSVASEPSTDCILDGLLSHPEVGPPPRSENKEAEGLMKKLAQLRELLPYYKDKPIVTDIGQYLADFSRNLAAVFVYKRDTKDFSEEFDYGMFIDSVSGFVKFILENLNFLTFEEDRSKIMKASDAILQVGIAFINHIRKADGTPKSSSDVASLQGKWERLCRLLFEYTLTASAEKSSVEEMREQAKRKLTTAILKLQAIYLKLCDAMSTSGDQFNQESFTGFLKDLANLSKATQAILSEESSKQVTEITRTALQASTNVAKTKAVDAHSRVVLEKYLALLSHTLLKLRDAI